MWKKITTSKEIFKIIKRYIKLPEQEKIFKYVPT